MLGVGAVADPVPPVATVYHFKVDPAGAVAVKAEAVAPAQYVTGELTVGAVGLAVNTKLGIEISVPTGLEET